MRDRSGLGSLFGAVVRRPPLWIEALRMLSAVRRRGRPWPSSAYIRWRSHTAYGEVIPFPIEDLTEFLEWRRSMRRMARGTGS